METNSSSQVASYASNKYCQAGVDDIQTVFDGMQTGLGYCLQLSSGSHAVSSVFGISRESFIIAGVTAPLFAPTSVINGPVNFGVSVNERCYYRWCCQYRWVCY